MADTITCPHCGRTSSSRAKWCIGCRTPFGASEPGPDAAPLEGCRLCGRPAGDGTLEVQQRGESRTTGIPLVFSVTTTDYAAATLGGFCTGCLSAIDLKRVGTSLGIAVTGLVFSGLGAGFDLFPLLLVGVGVIALTLRGLKYGFADDVVWGSSLAQRLGLAGTGWEFPASSGLLIVRALLIGGAFVVAIALVKSTD